MVARVRNKDETYDQYRKALNEEEALLRTKLNGTIMWPSKDYGTAYAVMTEKGKAYTDINPKFNKDK